MYANMNIIPVLSIHSEHTLRFATSRMCGERLERFPYAFAPQIKPISAKTATTPRCRRRRRLQRANQITHTVD